MFGMGFGEVILFILVELYGNEKGYVLFRRKPHSKGPHLSMQTHLLHPPPPPTVTSRPRPHEPYTLDRLQEISQASETAKGQQRP